MLKTTSHVFVTALAGVLMLAVAAPAAAENSGEHRTAAAITWSPEFDYAHATIAVSGPAGVTSMTVAKGSPLLIDTAGLVAWAESFGRSADGSYNYEIRFSSAGGPALRNDGAGVDTTSGRDKTAPAAALKLPVLSGHFRVLDGQIVIADATEAATPKDVVHADDVIINGGSLCVGFDCVNGESFGFDTLRLKENNIRLHFDDTSASASFPANDWRLMANDSSNGGLNYFGVEDSTAGRNIFVLEAGAPSNSLYVDDGGRLGLGTSVPVVEIHMVDGNTPTVRLDQDNSQGWGAYVWDVAANETNFFIRDVSGGSDLPFRIQPGAPDDLLTLRANGNVGMGTWGPTEPLEIKTTGEPTTVLLNNTGNGTWYLTSADDGTFSVSATGVDGEELFILDDLGNLTTSGTVNGISDRDRKFGFTPVNAGGVLKAIADMSITSWSLIGDTPGVRHMGPTAQDFYAAFGLGADERHIAMSDVGGVALAAIKALSTELEARDKVIESLEQRLLALEKMMH